jgi:hypothetical protein
MTRNARIGVLLGGIVVIVAAFVIISATSGGDSAPDSASASVTVANGRPDGGLKHITVKKGGAVDLAVTSNIADEVHVHGYDIERETQAGKPLTVSFKASINGIFEIELHHADVQIGQLTVQPK